MANLASAKKAMRQSRKRTVRNLNKKRKMRKLIKEVRDLADKGDKEKALKRFQLACKTIDKAAKSNVIHKNTASRYKSRLAKRINKTSKKS